MDELVHHCLLELSFDGDLGEFQVRDTPAPITPREVEFESPLVHLFLTHIIV